MGGYALQGWEVVGARVLGLLSSAASLLLVAWLVHRVALSRDRTAAGALALRGSGLKRAPHELHYAHHCLPVRLLLAIWSGDGARLPLLVYCASTMAVSTLSVAVVTFNPRYPWVPMWPDVYAVRLVVFAPIGGLSTLIVVRRLMVITVATAPRAGRWLWRIILIAFIATLPFNFSGMLTGIMAAENPTGAGWRAYHVPPAVIFINFIDPLVCMAASIGMAVMAYRSSPGLDSLGSRSGSRVGARAGGGGGPVGGGALGGIAAIETFRPDRQLISSSFEPSQSGLVVGGAQSVALTVAASTKLSAITEASKSGHSLTASDVMAPAPNGARDPPGVAADPSPVPPQPAGDSRPVEEDPVPLRKGSVVHAKPSTVPRPPSSTTPRSSRRASLRRNIVRRTLATFRVLNALTLIIWMVFLAIQGFGLGSPLMRGILSDLCVTTVLAMESALQSIMRLTITWRRRTTSGSAAAAAAADKLRPSKNNATTPEKQRPVGGPAGLGVEAPGRTGQVKDERGT
ncbi:hypothetical protein AMAG_18407 [Allomyces macrogynus ATCC 38327]|uniref:Uncharacterized protein n=1 Tax=Allomyces macrogynus (strain ATCC 38327) TaxID=578462 RepID=A0A0L0SB14_ALLM3|nr:hypothetical protein AMAG_18407 [Allomyces macrogynus ATCC 38327]|eukprot:KNE59681.1 hypothetical protein AMAG_18407 [Allomyces macrogynus ATCC 38327]